MNERQKTGILIAALVVALALQLVPSTMHVPIILARVLAWAAAAGVVGWMAFDMRLWRTKNMLRDYVDRPDLHGTWGTTLRSNWTDPTTGKTLQAIEAYMVIKQTWSGIKIKMLTGESTSDVLDASVLSSGDGKFRIAAIYCSNSQRGKCGESGHTGMLILDVPSKRPKSLTGRYSTDRGTEGEIEMNGRSRALFNSFREASSAFAKSGRRPAREIEEESTAMVRRDARAA